MTLLNKILIPLDGFDLSEEAIPYGEELAQKAASELILFHICEFGHKGVHSVHQKYLERVAEDIEERLGKNPSNHIKPKVSTVHLIGNFIKEICDYVAKENVDLVIMADHDVDLKEQLLGTITEKVSRKITCPTLLVRVTDIPQPIVSKGTIKKILVSLDGGTGSEVVLPIAKELSGLYDAEISLFMMGNKAYNEASDSDLVGDQGMDDEKIDMDTRDKCYQYLEEIEKKIKSEVSRTSVGVTLGNNPARGIRDYGKKINADMVIMATRGKAPFVVWPVKSTAFKLMEIGRLPLLLVKTK